MLLDYIAENSGPVSIDEAADYLQVHADETPHDEEADNEADEVTISLVHVHLPKLRNAGIVEVNKEAEAIETGEMFDTAESILDEA